MRRILAVIFLVLVFFSAELVFHFFGYFFKPNLLLLLIMFFNFYFGIRYGILSAVLAGALKDSFSAQFFGMNCFAFIVCAYAAVILKRYFFHMSISSFRLLLIFSTVIIYNLSFFFLSLRFVPLSAGEMLRFVLIPELISTLMITPFILDQLKRCALKFFV